MTIFYVFTPIWEPELSLAALQMETAAWYALKTRLKYKGNTKETNIMKYGQINCGNITDTHSHKQQLRTSTHE